MAILTVLLVVGSVARIAILVLRPSATARFHPGRRRVLATRAEQLGDVVVLITAVSMLLFGYRHHPPPALILLWAVALLGGFAAVLFAHAFARTHRTLGPPYRS